MLVFVFLTFSTNSLANRLCTYDIYNADPPTKLSKTESKSSTDPSSPGGDDCNGTEHCAAGEGKKEEGGKEEEENGQKNMEEDDAAAAAAGAAAAGTTETVENMKEDDAAAAAPGAGTTTANTSFTTADGSTTPEGVPAAGAVPVPVSAQPAAVPAAAAVPQAVEVETEAELEEKGYLPPLYVGRVIGKGGEMVRDLQARSGCRIDLDQNVPDGANRIITYRGPRAKIDFAKHLVDILCQPDAKDSDLPLGEAQRKMIHVPATVIGKIIGRGGEMIRSLQTSSQAKIQVDHSGAGGTDPTQRQITVTGTPLSVTKAEEMIGLLSSNPQMDAAMALSMLIREKTAGGSEWGSGPPYASMPNGGQGMTAADSSYGGYGGAVAPGGGYAPAAMMGSQVPQSYPSAAGGGQVTEVFPAAKTYMGRIIGQKGVTINDLQRRSGCDIQINQDVAPGQDCTIQITGPPAGVAAAKQMLTEVIELGPQHPYAGGAPREFFCPCFFFHLSGACYLLFCICSHILFRNHIVITSPLNKSLQSTSNRAATDSKVDMGSSLTDSKATDSQHTVMDLLSNLTVCLPPKQRPTDSNQCTAPVLLPMPLSSSSLLRRLLPPPRVHGRLLKLRMVRRTTIIPQLVQLSGTSPLECKDGLNCCRVS